ncbi:nucleotidyltransferase domain-containing protein [Merismopedia glauca]|uniref:Nucleotidyltransferase domain-containing protein n=1 Tax=Merismopedia glauca CCAP 1448/3 TaxID=1296344 RepID=A0A2T1BZR2_9CYAN|nr:nucleotidyltransferase domain-containing protein [Merismopedia glauca]PSB01398.1 nucleotidyltransferase domain-containing protein [Merismopedia glauca CCAP 1448/3]
MPPVTEELLETITQRLVAELNPESILLFGSYAWGEPNKYSDIDLCVIVPDGIPGFNRVQWAIKGREAIADIDADVDVMVKTRSDVETFKKVKASLTRKIVEEGKVLYEPSKANIGANVAQKSPNRSVGSAKVSQ